MDNFNINTINIANLAYLGDAVYELEIRNHLLKNNKNKVSILKEESTKFVSANAQSLIIDHLISEQYLTTAENDLVLRARNYKTKSKPKNALIKDYKKATALEALFGYLYLNKDDKRIKDLIDIIVRR